MELQPAELAENEYQRACKALASGKVLAALSLLESALRQYDNPQWHSRLGFCMAKERGQFTRGLELCRAAVTLFPDSSDHYYYYGRVLLLASRKAEAIQVLRQGLCCGDDEEIRQLLDELGTRKSPVIGWLGRDCSLNRFLGMLLARVGLR